ncbi:hypothetical protein CK203_090425 [Vitis vinifera]|uniref:Uncharacterized protein n=1 Tax=Vitis vinifera TaxID=29760 RepID=A0A438BVQ0_VITVI|nr:hypothetical protein CK203_090425 [Vitis vinifera]
MSKVFNGVLKGACNLPITALVQLTFYRVNSYFTVKREHGASQLASGEEFTPCIEAKIKVKVVKVDMDARLFPSRLDPDDTSVLTLQHQH